MHTVEAVRLLPEPFPVLLAHRNTIQALGRRDPGAREAASVLGPSWAVMQLPVVLLFYTVVSSVVLRVGFGASQSAAGFIVLA